MEVCVERERINRFENYHLLNFAAQSIVYFVIAFFIVNFGFSLIEALVNPFLGDNFGLNIEYISYVFSGVVASFFVAIVTTYVRQHMHFPAWQ